MPKTNDILVNPYELVETITIKSKLNKKILLEIYPKKVGYNDTFIVTRYTASMPSCEYSTDDIPALNKFVELRSYCMKNIKHSVELIDAVSEFYKKNKKMLKLTVSVIPTKQDKNCLDYVIRELFTK